MHPWSKQENKKKCEVATGSTRRTMDRGRKQQQATLFGGACSGVLFRNNGCALTHDFCASAAHNTALSIVFSIKMLHRRTPLSSCHFITA
jgi:hypothetical protein